MPQPAKSPSPAAPRPCTTWRRLQRSIGGSPRCCAQHDTVGHGRQGRAATGLAQRVVPTQRAIWARTMASTGLVPICGRQRAQDAGSAGAYAPNRLWSSFAAQAPCDPIVSPGPSFVCGTVSRSRHHDFASVRRRGGSGQSPGASMETAGRRLSLTAQTVALRYASNSAYVAGMLFAAGLVLTVLSLGALRWAGQTLASCAEWVGLLVRAGSTPAMARCPASAPQPRTSHRRRC
jgi:hypothetical protein